MACIAFSRPAAAIFSEIPISRASLDGLGRFTRIPPVQPGDDIDQPAKGPTSIRRARVAGPAASFVISETQIMETMTHNQSVGTHNQQCSPQTGGTTRCHTTRNGHTHSHPTADSKKYALATGEAASHRLHVLHNVYGFGTR